MRRLGFSAIALCFVIGLLGCAEGEKNVLGLGTLTVVGYSSPTPALIPEVDTITGTGFQELVGVPCTVRYTAAGGATIFDGGRSNTVDVIGTITSSTTCSCTSPIADICGPTSVFAFVTIILPSGVFGTSAAAIAEFVAPTAVSIAGPGGGTAFPAAVPSAFVITGTGFGPIGGEVSITWTSGSALFEAGASLTTQTKGTIASAMTIAGVSPLALVCGVASVPATITNVQFNKNTICTPTGTAIPVSFAAPTITSTTNLSTVGVHAGTSAPGEFAAAVPEPFRITGTGFGPVGGTAHVLWTNNAVLLPPPFQNGTSNAVVVPGTIISSTVIEGVSPPAAFCSPTLPDGAGFSHTVTMPDGACSIDSGFQTMIHPPRIFVIANDNTAAASFEATNTAPFTIIGDDFGPVGGTAFVTFTSASAAPADLPFRTPAASATITVEGTIVDRMTIASNSPIATLIPLLDAGGGTNCVMLDASTEVDILLEGGSCNAASPPLAPLVATFTGPAMVSVDPTGAAAAPPPTDVVSTILLGETEAEEFVITGSGFGPVLSIATVTFFDEVAVASVTVPGLVTSSTTIEGELPVDPFGVRLQDDVDARVTATFFNGSQTYCNNAVNFVAPPTMTVLSNARGLVAPGTPSPRWLACMGSDTTISGNGFDPAMTDLWYDHVLGDTFAIGAGLLGTIPEPTATAPGPGTLRTLTDNVFPVLDTLNGFSPTDATLTEDRRVTLRVVNPDQQFHEFASGGVLTWAVTGVMPNQNAGPLAGNNAEMQICVNPTNPLNACITAHDLRTINGQFSNQIYHAYTLDGGDTWVQFPIGPDTTAFPDGIGPAPRALRFDPMGAFDAYGNYFAVYLVDDNAGPTVAPSRFAILQRSSDGGATFDFTAPLSFPPSPGLDRETIATGPNVGFGPGGQALYCSLVDFANGAILNSKVTIAGPGPGGVVTVGAGTATVSSPAAPPPGRFYQHGTPSVGPAGETYVSYIEGDALGIFPLPPLADTRIFMDVDLLGGGVFLGADTLVATTLNAPFRLQDGTFTPMVSRGKAVVPMHKTIPVGPNAGRVVIAWSDMNPFGVNGRDTTVVTQYSDDQNLTWSALQPVHGLQPDFQFHPWMGVDPVRGDLYLGYYDTRNDPARQATEWMVTASTNGHTWTSSLLVAQAPSNAGAAGSNDMLEYNGICVVDGCVYTCWADNSNSTLDNPDGTLAPDGFDVLTSVLMLDPD